GKGNGRTRPRQLDAIPRRQIARKRRHRADPRQGLSHSPARHKGYCARGRTTDGESALSAHRALVELLQERAVPLADLVPAALEGDGQEAVLRGEGLGDDGIAPYPLDGGEPGVHPVDGRADGPPERGILGNLRKLSSASLPGGPGGGELLIGHQQGDDMRV